MCVSFILGNRITSNDSNSGGDFLLTTTRISHLFSQGIKINVGDSEITFSNLCLSKTQDREDDASNKLLFSR